MMGLRTRLVVLAPAAFALSLAASPRAHAQARDVAGGTTSCSILEIRASNDPGGVDRELAPLERKLKKPPFSSWKSFKLLKRHEKTLEKMKALNLGLVTGGKLALLFRGASGGQASNVRLRLTFALDDKAGKRQLDGTINIDSGDYSLLGGDSIEGGTYIVAVTCKVP